MNRFSIIIFLIVLFMSITLLQCNPATYQLTVVAGYGGSIITPSSSPVIVVSGESIDIIAEADTSYAFINWSSSDSGVIFGDANDISTTVTLTEGNATVTANFILDVAEDVICVDVNYTGGGSTGSALKPYTDIETGITQAESNGFDSVYVATGIYDVTDAITMIGGISVYGGFNNDNGTWTRNPYQTKDDRSTYLTQITYTGSDVGVTDNPARAIEFSGISIDDNTIIEGFTILGKDDGDYQAAIICENSAIPIITYNTIVGGAGIVSYGVYADAASPTISYNDIDGGSALISYGTLNVATSLSRIFNNIINGGSGNSTYGVSNESSSTKIYNNTIHGGDNGNISVGIRNHFSSSSTIINNTIAGGICNDNSLGIINSSSRPIINNNIIFTYAGASTRYGIYEDEYYNSADASSLQNNNIFNCPTALYYDEDTYTNLTTISSVNSLTDIDTVGGNISVDPIFEDQTNKDWHLTASSPTSVTSGGLDLSSDMTFPEDLDGNKIDLEGNIRTGDGSTGWSIGAYEYD